MTLLEGLLSLALTCSAASYDYCKLYKTASDVDRYLAGEDIPTQIVCESDPEALKNLEFEEIGKPETYEILLAPVGYEENIDETMQYIIDNLNKSFQGIDVEFHYLHTSAPIGIERIERLAFLSDLNEAEYIQEKTGVNTIAFVINSDEYMGGGGKFPVFSGNSKTTIFLAVHEIGHNLSLNDGYNRYYGKNKLNGSELFLSIYELEPKVKKAYQKIKPPIIHTGNVCGVQPVFTFYQPGDVMDVTFWDSQLLKKLEEGWKPFNPLQVEIMNYYVEEHVEKFTLGYPIESHQMNYTWFITLAQPTINSFHVW